MGGDIGGIIEAPGIAGGAICGGICGGAICGCDICGSGICGGGICGMTWVWVGCRFCVGSVGQPPLVRSSSS
jgi:hypothetical protein